MCNGPKITAIYNLPLNLFRLVWREGPIGQPSYQFSPFNLLNIENKTCTLQLLYRFTNFCNTVIKLYLVDPKIIEDTQLENNKTKLPLP